MRMQAIRTTQPDPTMQTTKYKGTERDAPLVGAGGWNKQGLTTGSDGGF